MLGPEVVARFPAAAVRRGRVGAGFVVRFLVAGIPVTERLLVVLRGVGEGSTTDAETSSFSASKCAEGSAADCSAAGGASGTDGMEFSAPANRGCPVGPSAHRGSPLGPSEEGRCGTSAGRRTSGGTNTGMPFPGRPKVAGTARAAVGCGGCATRGRATGPEAPGPSRRGVTRPLPLPAVVARTDRERGGRWAGAGVTSRGP